ncbi:hypothetical protein 162322410 [Organic Lake phycodnavirus 1]|nr:hypothetical protein 162322410 [Organic Lake phycodnavirus 1]
MSIRSIVVKPSDLNVKKTNKVKDEKININTSTIRKMLLEKLKQHKKTQKNICLNKESFEDINEPVYGNLKSGNKPTYREWKKNNTLKVLPNKQKEPECNIEVMPINIEPKTEILPTPQCLIESQSPPPKTISSIEKTFKLGKNKKNKTISIFIKGNQTRKQMNDKKNEYKKAKLNTIKNILKTKNLIKFGTTAPSGLLKEIYESSNLCGEIYNKNANTLIHNFNINNDNIIE